MTHKIRWGIAGPGSIAKKFANDLQLVPEAQIISVGSRNLERAQTFATDFGATNAYGSYSELFACPNIDVVYIATPHTSHAALAIKAMEAGKNVLCEKPAGVNAQEVTRILDAAKANNVFFMEALWSRFNPSVVKVMQLVQEKAIGDLSYLHADFGFYGLNRAEESRILNPNLAGGSVLDIGIYPIFLAYVLLGKPTSIKANAKFYKTGVEIQTSILFDYPTAQAVLYSGLTTNTKMKAEVSGTQGTLSFKPRWHEAEGYTLEKDGVTTIVDAPTPGFGYTYEIDEVHKCLQAGKKESDLWSHQNSRDLIYLLDAVRAKAGIIFPFEQ